MKRQKSHFKQQSKHNIFGILFKYSVSCCACWVHQVSWVVTKKLGVKQVKRTPNKLSGGQVKWKLALLEKNLNMFNYTYKQCWLPLKKPSTLLYLLRVQGSQFDSHFNTIFLFLSCCSLHFALTIIFTWCNLHFLSYFNASSLYYFYEIQIEFCLYFLPFKYTSLLLWWD